MTDTDFDALIAQCMFKNDAAMLTIIAARLSHHLPEHHQHIELSLDAVLEDIDALGSALRDERATLAEMRGHLAAIVCADLSLERAYLAARAVVLTRDD